MGTKINGTKASDFIRFSGKGKTITDGVRDANGDLKVDKVKNV